jgi:AbrB family looped-hinge helix DNA binding protein
MKGGMLVRVSSRGRVVIPKRLRDSAHIHAGDCLAVTQVTDSPAILVRQDVCPDEEFLRKLRLRAKETGLAAGELAAIIRAICEEDDCSGS